MGEAFVEGIALASIRFTYPPRDVFFIFFDNIDAVVSASPVYNYEFVIIAVLMKDGLNGCGKKMTKVVICYYK